MNKQINKKLNTVLFMIGATLFNLILMFVLISISFLILWFIFKDKQGNNGIVPIIVSLMFIGCLVASFFIYNFIMKKIASKIDMERYFHPIFKKKHRS